MNTMLRCSLLAAAVLLCLWTPSAARADINAKDATGMTVLMHAAENGSITHLKALIAAGADVNAKDNDGLTALIRAALKGKAESVKVLIAAGADVKAKDNIGDTALGDAAVKGDVESVKALSAAGADVKAKDDIGYTSLTWAAYFGHSDCVKALIAAGTDVNVKNIKGQTALALAASRGATDCVKALIDAGADMNATDDCGDTALTLAISNGNTDCVKALIDAGADLNVKNNDGNTALILAAQKDNMESVKALTAAKTDVNARNNDGQTALMAAIKNGSTDCVKPLTAAGADVDWEEDADYDTSRIFIAALTDLPLPDPQKAGGIDCLRAAINEAATQMHLENVTVEAHSPYVLNQSYQDNRGLIGTIQGEWILGQIHWQDVTTGQKQQIDFTWKTSFPDKIPEETNFIPAAKPIFVPIHQFLREANCTEEDLLKLALNASSADLRVSAGCVLAEKKAPICDKDPRVRAAAVNKLTDQALLARIAAEDTAHDVRQAAKDRLSDLRK